MDIEKEILNLLKKRKYGLTIEEVSDELDINRGTASKYLFVLSTGDKVHVRKVGKAKLHYLKKDYEKMVRK